MKFKRHSRSAFTLIELLMALIISTMIMGASSVVFTTALHSWREGQRQARMEQSARSTADLIEHYLRAALPDQDGLNPFEGTDLSSDADIHGHTLTFYSAASGQLPRAQPGADRQRVRFKFEPYENTTLYMQIDSFPDAANQASYDPDAWGYLAEIALNVKSFKVLYSDGSNWVDNWSDSRLPRAVEFHLTFQQSDSNSAPGNNSADGYSISRMVTLAMAEGEEDSDYAAGGNFSVPAQKQAGAAK